MNEIRRRRLLASLAGSLAVPVAGCLQLGDDDDSESERPDDGTGDEDTSSNGDEIPTDPAELLQFDDGVSEATQERAIRALERTSQMLGAQLDEPITVKLIDAGPLPVGPARTPFDSIIDQATHRKSPDFRVGGFGRYTGRTRTLRIADPVQLNRFIDENPEALTDMFDGHRDEFGFDIDIPDDPFANYPDERLFAHEFMHAFQGDIPRVPHTADLPPATRDGRMTEQAVKEGAADFVAQRYLTNCLDGSYDPCNEHMFWFSPEYTASWMIRDQVPYVNGAVLMYHIHDRGGWDAVWETHEDLPNTAWAAMFPEQYLEDGFEVVRGRVETTPEGWTVLDSSTLGVAYLYEKLAILRAVSITDEDAQLPPEIQEALSLPSMFRTSLLEGWRGDYFVGLETTDDADETGYCWVIEFATADRADAFAAAVDGGYQRFGEEAGAFVHVDGGLRAVEQTDTTVTLGMAPDEDALATILKTNVDLS